MFKKRPSISFIIDKNNYLNIKVSWDKNNANDAKTLSSLVSMLESGELHERILVDIHEHSKKIKDEQLGKTIIENVNNNREQYKEQTLKNMSETNRFNNNRSPIIGPDVVLTAFKNSITT
jgi:hypothetical protein